MFWNKKKPNKNVQIILTYLTAPAPFIEQRLKSSAVRAGCRIFIMGIADILRQSQRLEWNGFVSMYGLVLEEHNLLPSIPVQDYIDKVGEIAAQNEDVERVLRQGAGSITRYLAEKDARAPMDLLVEMQYVEMNASSFSQL